MAEVAPSALVVATQAADGGLCLGHVSMPLSHLGTEEGQDWGRGREGSPGSSAAGAGECDTVPLPVSASDTGTHYGSRGEHFTGDRRSWNASTTEFGEDVEVNQLNASWHDSSSDLWSPR